MKAIFASLAAFILFSSAASAGNYVGGHFRRDGTYVAPHVRSNPDRSYNNNWAVKPNVNPYTGQYGTKTPMLNNRAPSYQRWR
jgi:hypothetical protein